ncbi:retinol dehydrogenase 12-like isoform X3 [Centruroides vittatus]|uniref:retinol dehydrogenase 12-like isoform X3 n=1 Tax=Centruroides vittatus TaxID=120091 RepID=UPI00350E9567
MSSREIQCYFTASVALLKKWLSGKSCHSFNRLDGKTVIITGGNTGIGKETAIDLSRRGASIILACRDVKKGKDAVKDIQFITGNSNIKFMQLDLASFNSIRSFSEEVLKSEPQIHILINNAGLGATPFQKTQEGYEMQFGVNHLGHFLLTLLLLDRIKSSAPARIINVSSMAYKYGKIKFDDLNSEKDYKPIPAYCQSKLANIYFTRELAKRLEGTNVTTYCLHPGVVDTELGRYLKDSSGFHYTIAFYITSKLFFKSTKQGAQTTIYCAVAEELANESGHFYTECRRSRLNSNATDDTVAEKLWKISEEMTGITI